MGRAERGEREKRVRRAAERWEELTGREIIEREGGGLKGGKGSVTGRETREHGEPETGRGS